MPLGVAMDELKAKQRQGNTVVAQDRKAHGRLKTVINPDGVEVQMSMANAQDMVNNVPGWHWPSVAVHEENPFARAPRRQKLIDTTGVTPQRNVTPDADVTEPGGHDKEFVKVQNKAMQRAAETARSKMERDNDGLTADQLDEDQVDKAPKAPVLMEKVNEPATVTRKQRANAKIKSSEDDAEVVTKMAGNALKETIKSDLADKARDDGTQD